MNKPRDIIRPVNPGQPIRADDINAIISYVRSSGVPTSYRSYEGSSEVASRARPKSDDALSWLPCVSCDAVAEFSIVEVCRASIQDDGSILLHVRKPTGGSTVFAGTENYPLFESSYGWVKLITPYEPVEVNTIDDSEIHFGGRVSPLLGTGFVKAAAVAAGDTGLIAAADSRVDPGRVRLLGTNYSVNGGTTTPCPGHCVFEAQEVSGDNVWVEVTSQCGNTWSEPIEACSCFPPTPTTTCDPSDPSCTTTTTTTTTTEPCSPFVCNEPDRVPSDQEVYDALQERTCCVKRADCSGSASWSYDDTTGQWTLDSQDCSDSCLPEPPDFCPDFETCTVTNCVPVEPEDCTTSTTTGTPGSTTTCDPGNPSCTTTTTTTCAPGDIYCTTTCPPGSTTTTTTCDPAQMGCTTTTCDPTLPICDEYGCAWCPPDSCDDTCSCTCNAQGIWVCGGGQCCDTFVIDPNCPGRPLRECESYCASPSGPCNCGDTTSGSCVTICPPPPKPCEGYCLWQQQMSGGWGLHRTYCTGGVTECDGRGGCNCPPPSYTIGTPDPCGEQAITATACGCGETPDCPCGNCEDCCPDPSTTTPDCNGECNWVWDDDGSSWSVHSSTCSGPNCNCIGLPPFAGDCDGQIQPGVCSDLGTSTTSTTTSTTSTTSTTTTTTTTTTAPPCCSYIDDMGIAQCEALDPQDCPPEGSIGIISASTAGYCTYGGLGAGVRCCAEPDDTFTTKSCCRLDAGPLCSTASRCTSADCSDPNVVCIEEICAGQGGFIINDCVACTTTTADVGACCYNTTGTSCACSDGLTEAACDELLNSTWIGDGSLCSGTNCSWDGSACQGD